VEGGRPRLPGSGDDASSRRFPPEGGTVLTAAPNEEDDMPATASVLVVDDNRDNRDLLAEYLTFIGCTVQTVATGAEAITVAEAVRPHVVLMDLGLPGIFDGWDATRRIKSHPSLKQTVVIAVTAHGFPADVERAMRAGCHAVVVKPYDVVALGQQVRLLVAERQRRVPVKARHRTGQVIDANQG